MKNFVKAMNRECNSFGFFLTIHRIYQEKLKVGLLNYTQIREFLQKPMFDEALSKAELSAWQTEFNRYILPRKPPEM